MLYMCDMTNLRILIEAYKCYNYNNYCYNNSYNKTLYVAVVREFAYSSYPLNVYILKIMFKTCNSK